MIGLSIFWIATKGAETSKQIGDEKYVLATIVIVGTIELLIRVCQWGIARKSDASIDLKIFNSFIRMSIILLAVPVIIFVALPKFDIKISFSMTPMF